MLLTLELPDTVARRLEQHVPAEGRAEFLVQAVQRALPRYTEDELEAIAARVEADEALAAEMRDFDVCAADGLGTHF
jgi:hypothetical protein